MPEGRHGRNLRQRALFRQRLRRAFRRRENLRDAFAPDHRLQLFGLHLRHAGIKLKRPLCAAVHLLQLLRVHQAHRNRRGQRQVFFMHHDFVVFADFIGMHGRLFQAAFRHAVTDEQHGNQQDAKRRDKRDFVRGGIPGDVVNLRLDFDFRKAGVFRPGQPDLIHQHHNHHRRRSDDAGQNQGD